uniref:Uncharacterized protein n=1 Tax=Photinus pyralis TaxID=7054 RepID=A0A1Y1NGL3_PHOPY
MTCTQLKKKEIKEKKRGGKIFVPLRCLMQIKEQTNQSVLVSESGADVVPTHIKHAPEEASSASSFLVLIFHDEEASQRDNQLIFQCSVIWEPRKVHSSPDASHYPRSRGEQIVEYAAQRWTVSSTQLW